MGLLIVVTFASAFAGSMFGVWVGLYIGSQTMIEAVKKAFGPDDEEGDGNEGH